MDSLNVDAMELPADPVQEEPSFVSQWLGRVVITVIIAGLYHYWEYSSKPPASSGTRVEGDWNPVVDELELTASQQLQDGFEDEDTNLIYDDIEDDGDDTDTNNATLIYDDIEEDSDDDERPQVDKSCNTPPQLEDDAAPHEPVSSLTQPAQSDPSHARDVNAPPPMQAKDSNHPGLENFRKWYETEASLYRIYTVGRTDGVEVYPPFMPKSERGQVSLKLQVTNSYRQTISVYWIDFSGREVHKGDVTQGNVFHQTTWIGHPWTFRDKESGAMLCHYIPYKIIPTTHQVLTVDSDEPEIGIHRFAILSLGQRPQIDDDGLICWIADPAFPTIIETTQDAAAWSFQEMSRRDYPYIDSLTKYLTNIVLHPSDTKFRQIRIAHKRFSQHIWNTPARGLFFAAGFVETNGYAELGSMESLPRARVQELSTILFYLEKWKRIQDSPLTRQPVGADGQGRANYGRR
ncbi:hypothetical protein MHU86_8187 [Fragilaria crotonensis]|nr:hypothetical protein MHU86_8187 [Fragilaria crotonensis]